MKKIMLAGPLLAACLLGGLGTASADAAPVAQTHAAGVQVPLSVTDNQLSDYDSSRLSNGKFADATSTYTRSTNKLVTTLHVATPYLFVAARGNVTTTVYADTPFGRTPVWQTTHSLQACGLWDPSCSSSPTQTWTDYPSYFNAQTIQTYASSIDAVVSVS